MAQNHSSLMANMSCRATPLRAEQDRSSIENAEEAPRYPGSLLPENAWLMSIKKPRKTSPALGSPFYKRDYYLYTTNRNAHSIATDEEHILGSISGLINENGELAAHRASRQIDKKIPGVTPPVI